MSSPTRQTCWVPRSILQLWAEAPWPSAWSLPAVHRETTCKAAGRWSHQHTVPQGRGERSLATIHLSCHALHAMLQAASPVSQADSLPPALQGA